MRKLEITRRKRFVACLGTLRVMIADPIGGDVDINGVKTRKLGDLKNGETASFEISEEETAVFIIADKATKSFYAESYPVPAGSDDVILSGANKYNPLLGNPFEFDNAPEETVEYRRAHRKKGYGVMTLFLIIGIAFGIAFGWFVGYTVKGFIKNGLTPKDPEPATFEAGGLSIVLTDAFQVDKNSGVIASKKVGVTTLREDFSLQAGFGDYTLDEYLEAASTTVDVEKTFGKTASGVPYIRFVRHFEDEGDWVYYAFAYKGPECFWLVQFFTPAEAESEEKDNIFGWAESVTWETVSKT